MKNNPRKPRMKDMTAPTMAHIMLTGLGTGGAGDGGGQKENWGQSTQMLEQQFSKNSHVSIVVRNYESSAKLARNYESPGKPASVPAEHRAPTGFEEMTYSTRIITYRFGTLPGRVPAEPNREAEVVGRSFKQPARTVP
jgi:hypothetical protein